MIFPAEDAATVFSVLEEVRVEICSRMLTRRSTNEHLGVVTISAGVAQVRPGESAEGLLGRADAALYASKRTGRNRVTQADAKAAAAA